MKIVRGLPTKKEVRALCAHYGLIHYPLDLYASNGAIVYGSRGGANEAAARVCAALEQAGFAASHRLADRGIGLTGQIRIERRTK